jgi:arginyl-tRNA synthetase
MLFENELTNVILDGFLTVFGRNTERNSIVFQPTRKEFPGDITLVTFGLSKFSGKPPEETAKAIGDYLVSHSGIVSGYNIVKGFLNIEIHNKLYLKLLCDSIKTENYGHQPTDASSDPVLLEYSSPNTNKPLHLGHIRNILLGYSVSRILEANGKKVIKVSVVNDRGIHICKSMLAWKKYGNGETPSSSGLKGDHLVGKYYVEFDKHYRAEIKAAVDAGMSQEEAEKQSPLIVEAQEMLRNWEKGDPEVKTLWKQMNEWVYEGFDVTYRKLGVGFDNIYYESETYLLGKELVDKGIKDNVFYVKPDGSVWIDLTADGLDHKLVRRSDGTSVYITQDLGTALKRFEEYHFSKQIYVVGNEQDYHFKVLFLILGKLGYAWAKDLYHLSYNMVDLPSGKMKSREGTVVDADDLIGEMTSEAGRITRELGKASDLNESELNELYDNIGLGALKYFILKVDPLKRMLFNPEESIDFNGNTGPFIQYTHARIRSVVRKAASDPVLSAFSDFDPSGYSEMIPKEKELVRILLRFPEEVADAGNRFSPAIIANYSYELCKSFNQFYHEHSIVDPANAECSLFRLQLASMTASIIKSSMGLLGINVPERM